MTNYLAIVKKDLHTLFVSPVAYVVLAVFFGLSGFFFNVITEGIIDQVNMMSFQSQQYGQAPEPIDVPALILRNFFGLISTVLLFLLPMVTMGVFSEERKRGTIELLFTSPLSSAQLILGKFSAVMVFFLIMLLPTVLNSLLIYIYSDPKPPLGTILSAFLGALLLGGALLAMGVFISSLTENQIVAAVLTFGLFLVLWVIESVADPGTTLMNETLRYLSILSHYEDFIKGIIDTQHVVFYLSFIALGLFLTSVSLDSVRWRQ